MQEENITWRSFWSGPIGTRGQIPSQWGVRVWPTIYILDHKGVIRYKGPRGEKMDQAVDTLLEELENQPEGGAKKQKRKRL